jgi:uncharacterized protein YjbI with pentapeptide repeats
MLRAPQPPDLPDAFEAVAEIGGSFSEVLLEGEFGGVRAPGVVFECSRWRGVDASGARLASLTLRDCVVQRGNLANLDARSATLTRVLFEGARLTGLRLIDAVLTDVVFRGCRIDLATFGGAKLERVTFDDCVLAQADYLEAQLSGVRWEGCDLGAADFTGARLRRCALRGCRLDGLVGVTSLRGAALEWHEIVEQAGMWAGALGIEVLDPSDLSG